ncbi:MAG: beta-ketoacyl synthase N-terminal-like domain-containing protein [Desulforhopalus sp.]
MMEKVVITGGDILTALGDLQTTWKKINAGESGLKRRNISSRDNVSSLYSAYPLGLIECLQGQGGSWIRLQFLLDQLLSTLPSLPENTSLFLATTKAAVDELFIAESDQNGQPWHLADYLKEKLQLRGPATTVSGACASGTLAVIQGAMAISAGRCESALVIGVDMVADFILAGFDSLKALSPSIGRPFDRNRDGLSLGDGGGWLLMSSAKVAERAALPVLAGLEGWGITCDATHITAPCRSAGGLKLVLDQVFGSIGLPNSSDISNSKLGGINAHGTGTVYNDAMELLAFKEKCGCQIPICSVKGAIGHTLGAAGVIETLLSIKSLHEMVLPPTVGLEEPADGTNNLSGYNALPLLTPSILSCNSGFGGINAAVCLSHPQL